VPVGVLRAVDIPAYDRVVYEQGQQARARAKATDLEALWNQGDTWDANTPS
jgi:hypothetical protein